MKIKTISIAIAAAMGLAGIGAQAQEYQSQSTVYGKGFRQTTYEDGSSDTTTWHVNGATGDITNVDTVRTHARPEPAHLTLLPAPVYVNTDLHASFEYATPVVHRPAKVSHVEMNVQATTTASVSTSPTPYVEAEDIANTERDRKAVGERAKVEAAQHLKNVKLPVSSRTANSWSQGLTPGDLGGRLVKAQARLWVQIHGVDDWFSLPPVGLLGLKEDKIATEVVRERAS